MKKNYANFFGLKNRFCYLYLNRIPILNGNVNTNFAAVFSAHESATATLSSFSVYLIASCIALLPFTILTSQSGPESLAFATLTFG